MTKQTCPVCTRTFTATRTDAVTCSTSCRSRARVLPELRGYAIRNVKRALSDLAEVTVGMPDQEWTELMDDIGQYLMAEVERISAEVCTDDRP